MTKSHDDVQGHDVPTFDTVVELLTMLDGSSLPTRIVYQNGPVRLEIERGTTSQASPTVSPGAPAAPAAAPAPVVGSTAGPIVGTASVASVTNAVSVPSSPTSEPVTAPIAGVFYRAPSPDAAPFVEIGQRISAEDVIGIVEVMKLMNSVRAGITGTVVEICVENAQLVEFEQVLVRIEPEA